MRTKQTADPGTRLFRDQQFKHTKSGRPGEEKQKGKDSHLLYIQQV